ncbi:putative metalloprotease CJM1_0395 family protein [Desulforhopalus sp. 52FAK]
MELQSTSNPLSVQSTIFSEAYTKNESQNKANGRDTSANTNSDIVSISQRAREKNASATGEIDSRDEVQKEFEQEFTQEERAQLTELKSRDTEVRAHEQAHLAAAGAYARGGASFTFQKGPDGQAYAVGGEVGIDLSTENDPNATIQKMQTIQRAAMAPASPSSTDRQVAAQASVKEAQARQELLQEQQEILLSSEEETPKVEAVSSSQNNSSAPSVSSLKASLAAYEQMSAM